jgi:HAD superfamily hydrolase (TIGR01549 family)
VTAHGAVLQFARRRAAVTRIRGVLFDVDGTLYHQRPLRLRMALELAFAPLLTGQPAAGLRAVRVLREYRRCHEELRTPSHAGLVASAQISKAARRAGVTPDEATSIVEQWMVRRPLRHLSRYRRDGLVEALEQLQRAGVVLGVLSDYPAHAKLEALGVADYFSLTLCTTDEGINALKPRPDGFLVACQRWGLTPEEVLYVGDRPEVDGAGALAAGLRCAIIGGRGAAGRDGNASSWHHLRGFDQLAGLVAS